MGDFTVNVRQKPMDFNRWQLGLYIRLAYTGARVLPDNFAALATRRRETYFATCQVSWIVHMRRDPVSPHQWPLLGGAGTRTRPLSADEGLRVYPEGDEGKGRHHRHLDERWDHCALGDSSR